MSRSAQLLPYEPGEPDGRLPCSRRPTRRKPDWARRAGLLVPGVAENRMASTLAPQFTFRPQARPPRDISVRAAPFPRAHRLLSSRAPALPLARASLAHTSPSPRAHRPLPSSAPAPPLTSTAPSPRARRRTNFGLQLCDWLVFERAARLTYAPLPRYCEASWG